MKLGSGENCEWTFIDILSVMGLCIGLQNLDLNIGQENLDNQTKELDRKLKEVVDDIHRHLQEQDEKIDKIMEGLYDSRRDLQ